MNFSNPSGEWIGLAVVLGLLVLHFAPSVFVLASSRSEGGTKFGWFLLTLFFTWLAFGVFLIVTHVPAPARPSPRGRPREDADPWKGMR